MTSRSRTLLGVRGPRPWTRLATAVVAGVALLAPVVARAADDPEALLTVALDRAAEPLPRLRALEALAQRRDALGPLVPRIATLLDDPNDDVRYQAGYVLYHAGDAGAPAVPALVRTLRAASDVVRNEAVAALGHLGPLARDAAPALRTVARFDPVADVRRQAAQALGFVEPALAREPIDDQLARLDAKEALDRMSTLLVLKGRAADLRALAPRLRAMAQTDADADVRGAAWRTAAALDPATPAPPAETLERIDQTFDADPATRETAVTALAHGATATYPFALARLLDDPTAAIRRWAARGLESAAPASKHVASALTMRLGIERDEAVRRALFEARRRLIASPDNVAPPPPDAGPARVPAPDAATAVLIARLRADDAMERLTAAKQLGALGPTAAAALPELRRVAEEDPDDDVRAVAARAVAAIGGRRTAAPTPAPEPAPPPPPPRPRTEADKLVGTWRGVFWFRNNAITNEITFGADGSVRSLATAGGKTLWDDTGTFTFGRGTVTLAFPGQPANVGTVTFNGPEQFVFRRTDVNVVITYDRIAR